MNYWEMRVEPLYLGGDIFTTEDDAYTMRMRYETIICKFCNSPDIVKNGTFRGTQRWLCRNCGRAFVDNKALPKMKFSIDQVSSALGMYFRGLSLKKISNQLQADYGYSPSDIAIYNWVVRFSKLVINEAESHIPNVSDTWIADETMLRIGGKKYWLWDIIDSETRYLLATHLSSTLTCTPSKTMNRYQLLINLPTAKTIAIGKLIPKATLNINSNDSGIIGNIKPKIAPKTTIPTYQLRKRNMMPAIFFTEALHFDATTIEGIMKVISGTGTVLVTRVYTRLYSVYNNQSRIAKKAIHNIMAGIVTLTSILSIILPPFKRHTILRVICATYSTLINITKEFSFVNHNLRDPEPAYEPAVV